MLITLLSYRESLSFEDIVFMLLGYAVVIFVALPFHEMATTPSPPTGWGIIRPSGTAG